MLSNSAPTFIKTLSQLMILVRTRSCINRKRVYLARPYSKHAQKEAQQIGWPVGLEEKWLTQHLDYGKKVQLDNPAEALPQKASELAISIPLFVIVPLLCYNLSPKLNEILVNWTDVRIFHQILQLSHPHDRMDNFNKPVNKLCILLTEDHCDNAIISDLQVYAKYK